MDAQKNSLLSFLPLLFVFVVFYFFLIKPQQKKAVEKKNMLDNLRVGDEVVLSSGIIAEIEEMPKNKDYVVVMMGEKSKVRIFKDAIIDKYVENAVVDDKKSSKKVK